MKRLLIMAPVLLAVCTVGFAQPQGEFQFFYQRIQGFDYNAGSGLLIDDGNFNGGGFGFVFNLNDWFGVYSQSSFFAGAEFADAGVGVKLINQIQGAKVTARELGPLNVFAKGGVGFIRFVFDLEQFNQEQVRFATGFNYGGGIEFPIGESLFINLELGQLIMSLPQITNDPNRDRWDNTVVISTGASFHF
ncbi:MAG: outer membrane beta-barrel protein [Acidobacteriota bacterium]